MDFKKDLEGILLARIKKMGITINYKDVHDLLIKYYNTIFKLIDIKPYKIHYSKELKDKMCNDDYKDNLKLIEKKFVNGEDINPHLGRLSFNPDFQDGLLNDWGIYHLHLSSEKDPNDDYLFLRSDWLLLCMIDEKCVYFIDVRPHNESWDSNHEEYSLWFRDDLLKIIKSNWEFLLRKYELNGVKLQDKPSKEEYNLRNHGITTMVMIDDKVYAPPGGGITAGGKIGKKIGSLQVLMANRLLNEICGYYRKINKHPKDIRKVMVENGVKPPSKLNFKLIDDVKYGLVIVEKSTGFGISIYNKYIKKL